MVAAVDVSPETAEKLTEIRDADGRDGSADAAGAIVETGATGTNVNDLRVLVLGVEEGVVE